ncbi:FAD-dependent oxidoreductase [Sandaracinus amylolyticus]|uniref:FAD-dependent oxidoreductase n=1 Tax=Sandaracinus amylolyticus TaxID=927083 RepID=UPI001F3DD8A8|nr:FAD-dependent oxidoreductase [Sandaracinus amylolyticus]UJR78358.1 Squalene synthase [Sandaracinus amylolyticus]
MRASRSSYDVAVVGGGPVGATTAIAFARRGAKVALLEADPRASRRFAGEWLHPTAVEVLDELRIGHLDGARARTGYGFVICPDDRSAPIEMPYAEGIALSAEHSEIVEAIRDVARGVPGIEWIPMARVSGIEGDLLRCDDRESHTAFEFRAGRIVGADGRASVVRQALGYRENSTLLSYMAAVELRNCELPFEGFGHVVLGGPGPALFYRISDDVIRGCLDVPVSFGARARTPGFLWDSFHAVLPPKMVPAFRAAIERGPSGWAANRFRPRADFGRGETMLVGDALGHVHPMTAIGMTMGMLDARAVSRAATVEEYERERRGYIPELLSNALYHCFRREDPSATEVRRAMFRTLRANDAERRRTMMILAASDLRRRSFGSAFLKIAAQAIGATVADATKDGDLLRVPGALSQYGEWMQWPAAIAVPHRLRDRYRGQSTPTHPIPVLSRFVRTADPLQPPEGDEPRAGEPADVPVQDAMARAHGVLLTELEAIARVLGSVPDAEVAAPAARMIRVITSGTMRPAMAARMTIARRRLAVEGVPRLIETGAWRTEALADLLLLLLDGSAWGEEPITDLAEGVRALLECQTHHGGFATKTARDVPRDHEGDLDATALACRAIDAVLRRRPGASDADLEGALARAGAWLRARQNDDGSWPAIAKLGGGGAPHVVARTALALDALIAIDGNPGEPTVRRALKWLATNAEAWSGESASIALSSAVVRALCAARAPSSDAMVRAVRVLAAREDLGWQDAAHVAEALASYDLRRVERPALGRTRAKTGAPSATAAVSTEIVDADWAYCKQALAEVSRTFSKPIAMLPGKLEVAVTLGYLLCRIADTIEDHPLVDPRDRDRLFAMFLDVLENGVDAEPFERGFDTIDHDDPELSLARRTRVVMRVFAAQSERTRDACIRWVSEMARGMSLYSHRRKGEDGFVALHTTSDLERYCYYVAGTVGHLLTDLFVAEVGADSALELKLREDAEAFASGLQLVNILKDVTDDRERAWSFIPRTAVAAQGITITNLCDDALRPKAHAAVAPLFDVARRQLDGALRYALSIPPQHTGIRLFCLLPLWMAARTLVVGRGNDAMFVPGQAVKISREEVESIIAECVRFVADDDALRARYARLYDDGATARRASGSPSAIANGR